jgi:hypothetical protein
MWLGSTLLSNPAGEREQNGSAPPCIPTRLVNMNKMTIFIRIIYSFV